MKNQNRHFVHSSSSVEKFSKSFVVYFSLMVNTESEIRYLVWLYHEQVLVMKKLSFWLVQVKTFCKRNIFNKKRQKVDSLNQIIWTDLRILLSGLLGLNRLRSADGEFLRRSNEGLFLLC